MQRLAMAIGVVGLLVAFLAFPASPPDLEMAITGVSDLVELRTTTPDLEVSFRGIDLSADHSGPRPLLVTVKVSNVGGEEIAPGDFVGPSSWGFRLSGDVISVRLRHATQDYLLRNLRVLAQGDSVFLDPVALDAGAAAELEVILLHEASHPVTIVESIGKVVGVETFSVRQFRPSDPVAGFRLLPAVFDGRIRVQLIRILAYGSALVGLGAVSWLLALRIATVRQDRRRSRLKEGIAAKRTRSTYVSPILIEHYSRYGAADLVRLKKLISMPEELRQATVRARDLWEPPREVTRLADLTSAEQNRTLRRRRDSLLKLLLRLTQEGDIRVHDREWISDGLQVELTRAIEALPKAEISKARRAASGSWPFDASEAIG